MKEDFNEFLGLPQEMDGFLDGNKRTVYPVTMDKFPRFMDAFTYISISDMWRNFAWPEGIENIKTVLNMSFHTDIDGVMQNINAGNYKKIMGMIMKINGMEIEKKGEDNDPNGDRV